jgi:hypothetical protein
MSLFVLQFSAYSRALERYLESDLKVVANADQLHEKFKNYFKEKRAEVKDEFGCYLIMEPTEKMPEGLLEFVEKIAYIGRTGYGRNGFPNRYSGHNSKDEKVKWQNSVYNNLRFSVQGIIGSL